MLKRIRAAREDGFTLTELLIVVVVLGILAGIVVFAVNTFASDSDKTACEADKKTIQVAVEAYKAQSPTGVYPATVDDLIPKYLREKSKSTKYSFALNVATGAITVSPAGFC